MDSRLSGSFGHQLLFAELQSIQLIIHAFLVQKLLVIALLADLSIRQNNDIVRVLDRGQTVRNDQHGADVLDLFQGILD